jgi:hypothetical protein
LIALSDKSTHTLSRSKLPLLTLAKGGMFSVTLCVVFFLSLWFYGHLRSFPLLSDDGAANYVSMVHGVLGGEFFDLRFKIKWFEGLGQPNLFYSSLFDPFNWLLYTPLSAADAFRIGYALRATVCWVLTFWLATSVIPGRMMLAATAATLNVIMCFPLGTPGGVPAWAGIHHMTQVSVFPGLLLAYLAMFRGKKWLGKAELGFIACYALFLANYPLNSLIGVAVLFAFASCMVFDADPESRSIAFISAAKLTIITVILLFTPSYGFYGAWSSVTSGSARLVFNQELQTMLIPGYEWPNFWRYGMPELQVIVFLAFGVLLVTSKLPWAARAIISCLILCVTSLQIVTLFYAGGFAEALFRKLPAPSRVELYLTPFYSVCAAIAMHHIHRLLVPAANKKLMWLTGALVFTVASNILFGNKVAYVVGFIFIAAILAMPLYRFSLKSPTIINKFSRIKLNDVIGQRTNIIIAFVVTLIIAVSSLQRWKQNANKIHAPFGIEAICHTTQKPRWLCADLPGPSVNAADFEVTRYLRSKLTTEGDFAGRAEFLVSNNKNTSIGRGKNFNDMVQASTANWDSVRNGMVLLALPFQGIPVASSYEQILDYKYYLLWTRYLNRETNEAPTVNFTILKQTDPKALALLGIRYVISRGENHIDGLRQVFTSGEFIVWEVPRTNISGYAVNSIIFKESLTEELKAMRESAFDPRRVAVVSSKEHQALNNLELGGIHTATLSTTGQKLKFTAKAEKKSAFVILPFRHSYCWKASWGTKVGKIVRTNIGLIGIAFDHEVQLELEWSGGYVNGRSCLNQDNNLVNEAKAAAEALPFKL